MWWVRGGKPTRFFPPRARVAGIDLTRGTANPSNDPVPGADPVFTSAREHRDWLASQAALPRGFKTGGTRFDFTPHLVHPAARPLGPAGRHLLALMTAPA